MLMSMTRTSSRSPSMACGTTLFLVLAFFKAMSTVQGATITVNDGDKIQVRSGGERRVLEFNRNHHPLLNVCMHNSLPKHPQHAGKVTAPR